MQSTRGDTTRGMATGSNAYCERLAIEVPSLAAVRTHREANTFSLLLVALLEAGRPLSLEDVAARFEQAGIASAAEALLSLKRCRPARPPVSRDGDTYALDTFSDELDLWLFRLGLRPPKVVNEPRTYPPRPSTDQRLSIAELDEAFGNDGSLSGWSAQRIVLAILDAHDRPMTRDEVLAFLDQRTRHHHLARNPMPFHHKSAVAVSDQTWSIVPGAPELLAARNAVRDRVEQNRRHAAFRPDPSALQNYQQRRDAHAAELSRLRRAIIHTYPPASPLVVVVVDTNERTLHTFDRIADVRTHLARFDVLAGVDIRATLRGLDLDPETLRLAELGPPQKSLSLNTSTLKLTTAMLISGSCRISRPLGEPKQLQSYLASNRLAKLRERLETDAKSLLALHEYGRLHGAVRLRWRTLDEMFRVPWHYWDEPQLLHLLKQAHTLDAGIDAVVGAAPNFEDPWSRARRLHVEQFTEWNYRVYDADGFYVDERDIQLARLELSIN
jgi:hypothetical protein